MQNVITFIGARGGSKGLPRKNLCMLGGKPLIAHVIADAKKAKLVSRVLVFTDDAEIANVAKEHGAEVPFLLPAEFCTDTVKIEPVITYAVEELERREGYKTDIVVYLQSTDFFRKPEWIDTCIKALIDDPQLDSCFMAQATHKNYWHMDEGTPKRFRELDKNYGVRQVRKFLNYREDTGIACATRIAVVKQGLRIGPKAKMIPYHSFWWDIHTEFDLWVVEKVMTEWLPKDPQFFEEH